MAIQAAKENGGEAVVEDVAGGEAGTVGEDEVDGDGVFIEAISEGEAGLGRTQQRETRLLVGWLRVEGCEFGPAITGFGLPLEFGGGEKISREQEQQEEEP